MPDAMDADTEMTERDASTAVPQQDANDIVKELITLARRLMNQGKPSQALQAVTPLFFSPLSGFSFFL